MSTGSLILVTGVSGFLGSHVANELLKAGYRVRGTARSAKVDSVRRGYAQYGDRWEVVAIDDLVAGDFTQILQGVEGVIHVAAPMPGSTSASEALDAGIEGGVNILRQAEKAGVKRFALTSTIATINPLTYEGDYKDTTWTEVTKEQALDGTSDIFFIYVVEKTLAERAIWDFADKHPNIDVTTLNPSIFYGPFSPAYTNPDASISALSTNHLIRELIHPEGSLPWHSSWVDIRDVARGLVSSLTSPPTAEVGRKRIPMSGEWFSPKDAVDYIAEVRPELKGRLSEKAKNAPPTPRDSMIDSTRAKEILGVDMVWRDWRTTIIEAVDDILKLETEWDSKGLVAH